MEAKFRGKNQYVYGTVVPEIKAVGKKSLEWNLEDWKWDGDLFTASPLNPVPSDCRNKQSFPVDPEIPAKANTSNIASSNWDDVNPEKGKRELEKRRRAVISEGVELNDEAGCLNLNLGAQIYPIMEGDEKSGKKTKIVGSGTSSNRAVCQVEDCRADLSNAKDYHRRHKVCDMHSKASKALVGNVMQRFCQQCSRFHVLQEFDDGKRSCRRRLAGHNRRRRKTHPDAVVNGGSLNDESGSSYLLTSLLRILSDMHSNGSDATRDQDILSHLLRNLASLAGTINGRNIASLLEGTQGLVNAGTSGTSQKVPNLNSNGPEPIRSPGSSAKTDNGISSRDPPKAMGQSETVPAYDMVQKCLPSGDVAVGSLKSPSGSQPSNVLLSRGSLPSQSVAAETTVRRNGLNHIDLNNVYDDIQDDAENIRKSHPPEASGFGSLDHPSWLQLDTQKSSPPQTSINSDSTSSQSPSSSSGEAQSRTDRIVFKLFGKDPNDFPLVLRSQILSWLSHSPTEIESYIRPGCIILTVYLCLEKSAWEELCCNLGLNLKKLVAASNDSFWRTGWVYTRVRHSVAFLYDGEVVLDVPLSLRSPQHCRISSIKPLAVSSKASTQFVVKGVNLFHSSTRLLCALEGKYLAQYSCCDLIDGVDTAIEHDEHQYLSFSCTIPSVTGRGFIEVEDHGLSGSSFPFIVAEPEICTEICDLESVIEAAEICEDVQMRRKQMEEKTRALDFIQEMGWLLHRSRVKARLGPIAPFQDLFHFNRFKWLVDFCMDHDWCAVMKKLLDIMFEGTVDAGEHASVQLALLDLGLLHRAVSRNCRPMVELLLKFAPVQTSDDDSKEKQAGKNSERFLFKPDSVGPAGLTPLHVAASMHGSENVLDALIDDPGMVGIKAWKSVRDNTGSTPEDYASMRGYHSYIQLVQTKTSKKSDESHHHHVVDIPSSLVDSNTKKQKSLSKASSLQTERIDMAASTVPHQCGLCQHKLACHSTRTALVYRPAMLSMVAIAAVCVCVALLFKSSPQVSYVFQPFRWESLDYGSM
ncbi:squamosa promoter-binding-like protein 12 [Prosopis cineraria]|uniref:squamosa promoter-binding-like protein 12 n=1 Tax=Prosopis cineraria TaxID=364024 RepID=UPI00240F15C4|nr:squamosa promoter-binding-like protein 12 [Prosopis cineraria]